MSSTSTINRPVANPTRTSSTHRTARPVVSIPRPRRDYGPWDD